MGTYSGPSHIIYLCIEYVFKFTVGFFKRKMQDFRRSSDPKLGYTSMNWGMCNIHLILIEISLLHMGLDYHLY